MNIPELVGRFSHIFSPCAPGWKTYTRCNPRSHRVCQKCRLYKWKEPA